MRAAILSVLLAAGVAAPTHAGPQAVATICDGLAARARLHGDAHAENGAVFRALTGRPSPAIQIAPPDTDGKDVSLGRNPAADTRIMFEKRFRAEFGESPALVRELRNWDAIDVMTLPDSRLHMVLSTTAADQCESRIFFRTTAIREGERLPDPPAGPDGPVCRSQGGWGFLTRVSGTEAYLEYRLAGSHESFRVVPLKGDEWQSPCTLTVPSRTP